MKMSFPWKQALLLFAAVLVAYLLVFNSIEWARHRKGPWEVHLATDSQGLPFVEVKQPFLKISGRLEFINERLPVTNLSQWVRFDRPKKPVPFGKVIYEDLTSLPGVVTFDFFGHELEFLPRVMIVNKVEVPWDAARTQLSNTNKPPVPPKPAKGYD